MIQTPVLFLVFNRPECTKLVFEQIRLAKPDKLFIAADGPRQGNNSDSIKCSETKELIRGGIDWSCEVKTLYRTENLGCGKAVSEAITWFFENVEEGIILEDDCLPNQDFFKFCEELLKMYQTNETVMSISGSNLLGHYKLMNDVSYFQAHGGIWGWATWRRAWKLYDMSMKGWPSPKIRKTIKTNIGGSIWYQFYHKIFDATYRGSIDTWDIQWFYSILINNGVAINPSVNLTKNIGFNTDGTHTHDPNDQMAAIPQLSLTLPLIHPKHLQLDLEYLQILHKKLAVPRSHLSYLKKIVRWIFNIQ